MTGLMNNVSSCESTSPPTTATPSGWRSSAPAPAPERDRQRPEDGCEGRHHNGPEAQQAGRARRSLRTHADPPALDREVDHHDGVLLREMVLPQIERPGAIVAWIIDDTGRARADRRFFAGNGAVPGAHTVVVVQMPAA